MTADQCVIVRLCSCKVTHSFLISAYSFSFLFHLCCKKLHSWEIKVKFASKFSRIFIEHTVEMENIDHISFEQASAELLEKVHHTLSAFRQRFEGEDVDFAKLHRELVKRVNDELDVQPCHPEVVEVRPKVLDCDVVRFQNNKDKWVALIGLLDGHPYEIFTGLLDDEEGIMLPKSVMKGRIVKEVNNDGTKRYDFQFFNKRGYKMTIEGLSERFNPEYWNYAKLISGVLRYRMPIEHVIKLVSQLQLTSESINTWKVGVERALKKYVCEETQQSEKEDEHEGKE